MNAPRPAPPAFRARQFALAIPLAAIHGCLIAWAAAEVQRHFAPWLLFPILAGLVLGATLVAIVRLAEIGNRFTVILMTLVAVSAAIGGQHYFAYREAHRVAHNQAQEFQKAGNLAPLLAAGQLPEPPRNLREFLRREAARGRPIGSWVARAGWAWLSWGLDGTLLLAASLVVVAPALRQPYCDRCRSWHRTTRRGPLSQEAAAGLAAALGLSVPEDLLGGQYRLVACRGGCGPTGLEFQCRTTQTRPRPVRVWLDVERRNRVLQVLDQPMTQ